MRPILLRHGALALALLFTVCGISKSYGQDVKPVPIERAEPQYPIELRRANVTGQVIVEFVITTKGKVVNAFAVRSTHSGFESAAVTAVSKWRFQPGMKNGRHVNVRMQIPISFKLDGVSGPQIFRPLGNDSESKLSQAMRYEIPPKNLSIEVGAYPYEALLKNERTKVTGAVLISTSGTVDSVLWKSTPVGDEMKQAVQAMLDTARLQPATQKKQPVATMMWFQINFDPMAGDVSISDSAAAILKKLRIEGDAAVFTKSRELDAKIRPIKRIEPVFPRLVKITEDQGTALIEIYIDQDGNAQLPRIVTASEPAFGYAACQAIAQWQFEPPLKDGKPVVVKVRVPFLFKR